MTIGNVLLSNLKLLVSTVEELWASEVDQFSICAMLIGKQADEHSVVLQHERPMLMIYQSTYQHLIFRQVLTCYPLPFCQPAMSKGKEKQA